MISKERLEELIEKSATVYSTRNCHCIKNNLVDFFDNMLTLTQIDFTITHINKDIIDWLSEKQLAYLFETKEDAEEYAEFGNITRTERLELPSWEDVKKDSETLKYGTYTIAEYKHLFSLNLKILKYYPTQIVLFTDTEKYGWNLSRENYNEARRLCVKLFKGEE